MLRRLTTTTMARISWELIGKKLIFRLYLIWVYLLSLPNQTCIRPPRPAGGTFSKWPKNPSQWSPCTTGSSPRSRAWSRTFRPCGHRNQPWCQGIESRKWAVKLINTILGSSIISLTFSLNGPSSRPHFHLFLIFQITVGTIFTTNKC